MTIVPRRRWKPLPIAVFLSVLSFLILKYTFPKFFRPRRYEISSLKAIAYNDDSYPLDEYGFLDSGVSKALCRGHGWYPYSLRNSRRKVYDLFMINTEIDWLNIRLNELHHEVDYFVIIESSLTFDNQKKPLHVKENWESLKPFHDKIIYHELNNTNKPDTKTYVTWESEQFQRDAMYDQVLPYLKGDQKPRFGDIILVSNVDELPRPSTLKLLRNCNIPRRLTLRSRFYSYSFQWLHRGQEWDHPQATTYLGAATIRPNDLRGGSPSPYTSWWWWEYQDLWNAAWHCSNCFPTIEETVNKLQISSNDREAFKNQSRIVDKVRKGQDLWGRPGEGYDRVVRNEDIPNFLRMNQERFKYLLDRDPEHANFKGHSTQGKPRSLRSWKHLERVR